VSKILFVRCICTKCHERQLAGFLMKAPKGEVIPPCRHCPKGTLKPLEKVKGFSKISNPTD